MKYSKGFKYILREEMVIQTNVKPKQDIDSEFVGLSKNGLLTIKKFFAWDGCSGPTFDDEHNMIACCIHDAFYYLMRKRLLNTKYKFLADEK
jgi:hypothetical protein